MNLKQFALIVKHLALTQVASYYYLSVAAPQASMARIHERIQVSVHDRPNISCLISRT